MDLHIVDKIMKSWCILGFLLMVTTCMADKDEHKVLHKGNIHQGHFHGGHKSPEEPGCPHHGKVHQGHDHQAHEHEHRGHEHRGHEHEGHAHEEHTDAHEHSHQGDIHQGHMHEGHKAPGEPEGPHQGDIHQGHTHKKHKHGHSGHSHAGHQTFWREIAECNITWPTRASRRKTHRNRKPFRPCVDNKCPSYTVQNKTKAYELRCYRKANWVMASVKIGKGGKCIA